MFRGSQSVPMSRHRGLCRSTVMGLLSLEQPLLLEPTRVVRTRMGLSSILWEKKKRFVVKQIWTTLG